MAEIYTNLNSVTLYKTPKFNKIDSVMFSSKANRDNYFNSIPESDKLFIDEFTDLFEGRSFALPYNYLDLKEYNTMKLHYNDGLGHIEDYYCNVDNYLYISTDVSYPVYRIDYFLTYSYLLYNKTIDMVTDRRTVSENSLNKNMKADAEAVPRLKYEKHETYFVGINETVKSPYYIVYLNKTTGGVGKLGIKCNMQLALGQDSNNVVHYYDIDTYTIGCYIAIADKDHLDNIISNEPLEYIEKIIEVDTPVSYIDNVDYTTLTNDGYVYLTKDIVSENSPNGTYYYGKVNFYNEGYGNNDVAGFKRQDRVNIYPNHKKRILEWQPTKGIVIQGQEFDIKDFDDNDFPSISGVETYFLLYSTIYFFNFLGYTFAYPLGYKHEAVNMDYMIKWQSGRNFEYSSVYTNSLAYKELQEYNTQAVKYAKQQAGVQSYYNNQLLKNAKENYDISRQQTILSYQNQHNSLATETANLREQHYSIRGGIKDIWKAATGWITDIFSGGEETLSYGVAANINQNNIQLLRDQQGILIEQQTLDLKALANQYKQMVLNTQYQNDCLAIARDNTIANVAISNKYNNAKPNAYYETDFTQFSSYYYTYYIDTVYNDSIEQNIKNRYNVLGTYVGYIEKWQPNVYEGLYFDYIKGSIIDNSNVLSSEIPNDIYINLISRIEEGIRIWHPSQLDWFGNLLIDNTNLGTPEPYNTYTEEQKADVQASLEVAMYDDLLTPTNCKSRLRTLYPTLSSTYTDWCVDNEPWGTATIPADRQAKILFYKAWLFNYHTEEEEIEIFKNADFLTVYEKQWVLPQI